MASVPPSPTHAVPPRQAYFQSALQMVSEAVQVINDTQSVGYSVFKSAYPLMDQELVHNLSSVKCEQCRQETDACLSYNSVYYSFIFI